MTYFDEEMNGMRCKNCGKTIDGDSAFCMHCGSKTALNEIYLDEQGNVIENSLMERGNQEQYYLLNNAQIPKNMRGGTQNIYINVQPGNQQAPQPQKQEETQGEGCLSIIGGLVVLGIIASLFGQ